MTGMRDEMRRDCFLIVIEACIGHRRPPEGPGLKPGRFRGESRPLPGTERIERRNERFRIHVGRAYGNVKWKKM
jgi:hypothetical protein